MPIILLCIISRHHGPRCCPCAPGFSFNVEAGMNKPLSEMTLEELWELFPILLSEHKSCWKDWYGEEKQTIAALLPDQTIDSP